MNEERIKELFSNESFVRELLDKETPEEVQALLATKDIDLTIDEINALKKFVLKKLEQAKDGNDVEMDDEDLGDVSGGILPIVFAAIPLAIGLAFVVPTVTAGVVLAARDRW